MKNLLLNIKLMFLSLFSFQKEEAVTAAGPLSLDLQFFADPDPQDPKDPPADPPADPKSSDPPADPKPKDHMIPKSRFDEVNTNYKTVKEELDALKEAQAEAERKAQEKQGEYQTLYEQTKEKADTYKSDFKSTKTRVEALEGVMTSMLNTKLESIPDEYHDLIPDNLSPEQKLDWISKAETKGFFKDKSQDPVGGPTNPSPQNTDFEGMSPMQLLSAGYGNKK